MKAVFSKSLFTSKIKMKRLWLLSIIAIVSYLAFIIWPIYTAEASPDGLGWVPTHMQMDALISLLSMRNGIMVFTSVAIPFITALFLFSNYARNQDANEAYMLSLTKKQLFCTNMLVGLHILIIPLIIFCIILLIPIKTPIWNGIYTAYRHTPDYLFPKGISGENGVIINTFPVILAFFTRAALVFVFYFTLFVMGCSITRKNNLVFILCLFQPIVLFLLFASTVNASIVFVMDPGDSWHVFTFGQSPAGIWEHFLYCLFYTHPIGWMFAFTGWFAVSEPAPLYPFYLCYMAIMIVMLHIAYTCYRSHER